MGKKWSPDGVLYFVSDCSGWWNLYRWQHGQLEALCPAEAEFGFTLADPVEPVPIENFSDERSK
jgi:hypothetical protein